MIDVNNIHRKANKMIKKYEKEQDDKKLKDYIFRKKGFTDLFFSSTLSKQELKKMITNDFIIMEVKNETTTHRR